MASLTAHLRVTGSHGHLPFRDDCPRCHAERLHGRAPSDALLSPRSRAALAATVLAGAPLSAAAVPAAQAQVEEENEGIVDIDDFGESEPGFESAPEDGEPEREQPEVQVPPVPTAPDSPPPSGDEPSGTVPAEPPPTLKPIPPPKAGTPRLPAPAPPLPPLSFDELPQSPVETPTGGEPRPLELRFVAPADRGDRPPAAVGGGEAAPGDPAPPSTDAQPLKPLPRWSDGHDLPQLDRAEPSKGDETAAADARSVSSQAGGNANATYRVAPDDSLWSIAEAQLAPGADNAQIAREVNRLWNLNAERIATGHPDLLMVGTVLRLG